MSISRADLSNKLFEIVKNYYNQDNENREIVFDNVYLNYSEEEKTKSQLINDIQHFNELPNDFIISYQIKNGESFEKYILLNEKMMEVDEYLLSEVDSDIIDLFIIAKEDSLKLSHNITYASIYDSLCIYTESDYKGHEFEDIKVIFNNFYVYKINENSLLYERGIEFIYSYVLIQRAKYSEFPWNQETLNQIELAIFSESEKIPYLNVIMALCTNVWKHIFLESYKMIEHLFFMIYLKDVPEEYRKLKDFSIIVENILSWRPNEESSIEKIFEEIKDKYSNETIYKKLEKIKEVHAGDTKLHKWYYKDIRNRIAHFRAGQKNVCFKDEEWNEIISFNFFVVKNLYETYNEYIL